MTEKYLLGIDSIHGHKKFFWIVIFRRPLRPLTSYVAVVVHVAAGEHYSLSLYTTQEKGSAVSTTKGKVIFLIEISTLSCYWTEEFGFFVSASRNPNMASTSLASPAEEDIGGSSSTGSSLGPSSTAEADSSNTVASATAASASEQPEANSAIAKEDLIELIRAVKFKNPDFSQRQVYQEIVTEIPAKFPKYADSLNSNTLCLNDIKKAWKKAILQQQKQQQDSRGANTNSNSDLAEKLRKLTTNPEVYTVGLNNENGDLASAGSSMARDYMVRFLKEQEAESSAQQRQLLEDYVHVFLDVPADSSGQKPHQALINFQSKSIKPKTAGGKNNKKKKGKKKGGAPAATAKTPSAPFEDAIVVKIQMAAPLDANDTAKHPMLLYDQTRTYKTFVHPDGALTGDAQEGQDGYSRLARWIRSQGVDGALGASGGTKAYFYGRLTTAGSKGSQKILSIYVKSLAPPEVQGF